MFAPGALSELVFHTSHIITTEVNKGQGIWDWVMGQFSATVLFRQETRQLLIMAAIANRIVVGLASSVWRISSGSPVTRAESSMACRKRPVAPVTLLCDLLHCEATGQGVE